MLLDGVDQKPNGFPLFTGHQFRHQLHHGHLGSVDREGACQLQTNNTAAHDHHAAGQPGQVQRTGGIDAVFMTGNWEHHRHRAGGYDYIFALILLAAADHHTVLFQHGFPFYDHCTCLFQQELHAVDQFPGDFALSALNLLEAEAAHVPENVLLCQRPDSFHDVGFIH